MNFLDFEGKDPEDAISQAASYFNVPQEELEIEIVSLGSSGLFGLLGGRKPKSAPPLKGKSLQRNPKKEWPKLKINMKLNLKKMKI